jgi:hypothetical protein
MDHFNSITGVIFGMVVNLLFYVWGFKDGSKK